MANRGGDVKQILVVGGGLIGARHMQSVLAHPDCDLVGLVDPNPSAAPDVQTRRFADITDVDVPVDGVVLATPTHLHAKQGIYAAERGWHMLIEKPVADNLRAAETLESAIGKAGVGSLVGHHRRYHRSVQQLRDVIKNAEIGQVIAANLIWAMRKPDAYFHGNWRTSGGSPVLINLVHDIDLLRFVVGEITDVAALRGASVRGTDRIESGAVALAFENGATGTISFADTSPSPWGFEAATAENPNIGATGQDMLWIMGTKGAISYPSMTMWLGRDWGAAASPTKLDKPKTLRSPLDAQLDHLLAVMDGEQPLIDVSDATRTLSVALELEKQLTAQSVGGIHVRSAIA